MSLSHPGVQQLITEHQNKSIDGLKRSRIYLMRHSDVSYFQEDGSFVTDGTKVPLTEQGIAHAKIAGEHLRDVNFDLVVSSGYPRTIDTCKLVTDQSTHKLPAMQVVPEFVELKGDRTAERSSRFPHPAFCMHPRSNPNYRYNGGESFQEAELRSSKGLEKLLKEGFDSALIVAHGGINRAIMAWCFGINVLDVGFLEQDPSCVNIIDLYTDELGGLIRGLARTINYTAYDPLKLTKHSTTLEVMSYQMAGMNNLSPLTLEPK